MNSNRYRIIAIAGLALILLIAAYMLYRQNLGDYPLAQYPGGSPFVPSTSTPAAIGSDLDQVRTTVQNFGQALKNVSLLAPLDELKKSLSDNYRNFISPDLLDQWLASTTAALGRPVSSPWPDRIEIASVEPITADRYLVKGDVIETTSADASASAAARLPIELIVERFGDKWLISSATTSPATTSPSTASSTPGVITPGTVGWKTVSDPVRKISYQYPENFPAQYISPQVWPPQIALSTGNFNCPVTPASGQREDIARRTIGTRVYCINSQSGGAAGSTYVDYTYLTKLDSRLVTVVFTLRYPQCLNYEDPKRTECSSERTAFNLDALIDKIVGTIKNQ